MSKPRLVILFAEDDDGHASLVQRNLLRASVASEIVRVRDGEEALAYVRREGKYAGRRAGDPLLLLLDLKMPRVDGLEVLRQVRADKNTTRLPVFVLTTSDDPQEIDRCYELGCSVYITKPVDYAAFVEAIQRLARFLEIIDIPREVT